MAEGPQLPGRVCASCGYDLTGAASGTCPECGYTPTAEELLLAERRLVFVELTRFRQWWAYVWPLVPFLLLYLHHELWVFGVFGGVVTALVLGWSEVAGRVYLRVPRGQRGAARSVWRLSVKWLVLPLWAGGVMFVLALMLNEYLDWFNPYGSMFEGLMWRVPACTAGVGFVAAWRVWRWSWMRLARVAGLTEENREVAPARPAAKAVLWPVGVVVGLPVVGLVLDLLLDWLRPEWW